MSLSMSESTALNPSSKNPIVWIVGKKVPVPTSLTNTRRSSWAGRVALLTLVLLVGMQALVLVPIQSNYFSWDIPHLDETTPQHERMKQQEETSDAQYKVYLWTKGTLGGFRERLYNQEGWSTHPNTTLVDSPDEADLIVWISTMSKVEDEVPPSNYSNVIVLDYSDGPTPHPRRDTLQSLLGYFKRSFVDRKDGIFQNWCMGAHESVLPMAYSGAQGLVQQENDTRPYTKRPLEVTNVLRTEGYHNANRKRIVEWTNQYVKSRSMENSSFVGETGLGWSNAPWDQDYMTHLRSAKIIVTCNPNNWEGDFRLWESMLSGALVFVDRMAVMDLMPHPLKHKEHFVVYDSNNKTRLYELLDYYRSHTVKSQQIAEAGYRHVLRHHMPKDRVEYVLRNIKEPRLKRATQ